MTILFTGPEGCPADVATGQPQTIALETEVLRSLEQYLCGLPEPLISPKLYGLLMAVYSKWPRYLIAISLQYNVDAMFELVK